MPRQPVALLSGLLLSVQISVVWADEWLVRDRDGQRVEVIKAGPGDRLIRRDAQTGARCGSIEQAAGGASDPEGSGRTPRRDGRTPSQWEPNGS